MQHDYFYLTGPQGRSYLVSLAWPSGAPPIDGWPAALVLDTPQFERVKAQTVGSELAWPAALIGVGYAQTPAREEDYPPCNEAGETGGAAAFLHFLQQALIPAVCQRLQLNTQHLCLCGHSLAGLFALYVLGHDRSLFQSFLISSPSVWWAQGAGLAACWSHAQSSGSPTGHKPWVQISVGEYEQSLSPTELALDHLEQQGRLARRSARRMVDGAYDVARRLQGDQSLDVAFSLLEGCGHGEAGTRAFVQGWRKVLERSRSST